MKAKRLVFMALAACLALAAPRLSRAQGHALHGRVVSGATGEPLPFATCQALESRAWSVSDEYGRYALVLGEGPTTVVFSFSGYQADTLRLDMASDLERTVRLRETELAEVVVVAGEAPLHKQTLSGRMNLSMERLEALPSLTGQPDLVRALSFLPGAASGREMTAGLYVRGGASGQNLFLLDGAPLYNTNHFGNFFSTVNPDAIKDVDFYKGGFPARFGGRLSSVIDLRTRAGRPDSLQGRFDLGLVSANLLLEGPLGSSGKTGFLLAARGFYLGPLSYVQRRNVRALGQGQYLNYNFLDLNAKLDHQTARGGRFFAHAYTGSDWLAGGEASENTGLSILGLRTPQGDMLAQSSTRASNLAASAGWERRLRARTLLGLRANYSRYGLEASESLSLEAPGFFGQEASATTSLLTDLSAALRLDHALSARQNWKLGLEARRYFFQPSVHRAWGQVSTLDWRYDTLRGQDTRLEALELVAFWEDELRLSPKASLNFGLRLARFMADSAGFPSLEPRVSFRQEVGENGSFKLGATLARQFVHVLRNNQNVFEMERWLPASRANPPEASWQASGGWFGYWPQAGVEYGLEAYYKRMWGLAEFNPMNATGVLGQASPDLLLADGRGQAYGLEVFAQKKAGRFSGSLSYTLAWAWRSFPGFADGKRLPFLFDRRHDLGLVGQCRLKNGNLLSAQFVLASGLPISLPEAYVPATPLSMAQHLYGDPLNRRMPAFHRLDLMYRKEWRNDRGTRSFLTFNLYNAYARANPSTVYYSNDMAKVVGTLTAFPSLGYGTHF